LGFRFANSWGVSLTRGVAVAPDPDLRPLQTVKRLGHANVGSKAGDARLTGLLRKTPITMANTVSVPRSDGSGAVASGIMDEASKIGTTRRFLCVCLGLEGSPFL
jgi:hypothetical protein